MSFKSDINYKGINIQNAYFTINAVIELHCYASDEVYNQDKINNTTENKLYINTSLNFVPNVEDNSENWIKQAYQCTQILEKYPNKIDC